MSWYEKVSDEIKDNLKGFFKFRFSSSGGPIQEYNIWWEGLSSDVRIIKHDMPKRLFERLQESIEATAKAESYKTYKEVISEYTGH